MTGGHLILCGIQWFLTIILNGGTTGSTPYGVGLFLPLLMTGISLSGAVDVGTLSAPESLCIFYGWFVATSFWMTMSGSFLHITKKGRADLRFKHNHYQHTFSEDARTSAWRSCIISAAMFALVALIAASQPGKNESKQKRAALRPARNTSSTAKSHPPKHGRHNGSR